jgi:hypothetical protein
MPVSTRASSSDVGRRTLDVVWQTTILPRWDTGLRLRLLRKCLRRIEYVTVIYCDDMTLASVATHYHNFVAQLSPKAWLAANIATLMMQACDDLADAGNYVHAHQCLQCASHLRGLGPNATWNDISRLYNRGTFTNLNFELTPMNL